MRVSIITPSYNSSKFISGAIESVLGQQYNDIEYIVIDGGSTDGTIEILSKFPKIKWISAPDGGMYDAVNKGVQLATGEICAYLNCDDRYLPYTVRYVVEKFRSDPSVDFVYGNCEYIDERERPLFVLRPPPYAIARQSLRILWSQPTLFWREGVNKNIGPFDSNLRLIGDRDFMIRLIVNHMRGCLIKCNLARFMLRDGSLSAQEAGMRMREFATLNCRYGRHRELVKMFLAELFFVISNVQSYPFRMLFRLKMQANKKSGRKF